MIGERIRDRYEIETRLGQGGMGTVYRGHDALLNRAVAIKVLSAQGLGTEGRARMLAEAQAAASLNHPNIVTVFDAGEVGETPFVVMELISGRTLRDLPTPAVTEVIDIARQVCAALEHAHSHGVIHRDLKLENIFLTETGTIKLVDFGLARSSQIPHITQEGAIVGTFAYLAPELIQGQPASVQSDLYALGVTLYQLATGRAPFAGDNLAALVSQHLHVTPVPPSSHNPQVPPALELLILRLLAKPPAERPASAAEVREALDRMKDQGSMMVLPPAETLEQIVRGSFVAREREFAEARAHWQRALGGQGGVLLVSGEPGIGKTRLTRELVSLAGLSRGLALVGECYAEGGIPYAPVARILQSAFETDSIVATLDLAPGVLADLIAVAPALRSRYPDIAPNPPLEPRAEQQRLFDGMATFLSALATRAAVLWVVDDAHWADAGSLLLTRHLARRARNLPILIVLTYREVELSEARDLNEVLADLNRERLAERIKLTRFSREQTRDLLAALFAEEITPDFLEGIYRETEGNPFFVEEVCKALIEDGKLYRESGHWHRPDMDQIYVPQGVRVTIESRVERLPAAAQDVLRMAAVLGREFDFETVMRVVEQDEDTLIDALETAQHAQLISEVTRSGHLRFSFSHALIPSALRDGISALRLQRMYRRTAAALEATHPDDYEILAHHFAQGGLEEPALKYYRLAADRALGGAAMRDAEKFYRLALELATESHERADLMYHLGVTLTNLGQLEAAQAQYRSALAANLEKRDLALTARIHAALAFTVWQTGDTPAALASCLEGEKVLRDSPETEPKAVLWHELARLLYFNGQLEESRSYAVQALRMAEDLGARGLQVQCLVTRGLSEPLTQQSTTLLLAIRICRELQDAPGPPDRYVGFATSRALNNYAELLSTTGHYREALSVLQELSVQVRGVDLAVGWAQSQIAGRQVDLAEFPAAEASLAQARTLYPADEKSEVQHMISEAELSLRLRRGDYSALPEFEALLERNLSRANLQNALRIGDMLLDFFVSRGDAERALDCIGRIQPLIVEGGTGYWSTYVHHAEFCSVYAMCGRLSDARAELAKLSAMPQDETNLSYRASLARAEAHLACAESRWDDADAAFERYVAAQTEMGRRWHEANALYEWARSIAPHDRLRAVQLLEDAISRFESLGVPAYASHIRVFRAAI